MGRGLSELQQTILLTAGHNVTRRHGPHLWYSEVFEIVYGWENQAGFPNFGGHHFNPQAIGEAAYNTACAAVSRACKRLRARGLVQAVGRDGVSLTEAGRQVALALTVKNTEQPLELNQYQRTGEGL